jgi:hypothetical protein
MARNLAFLAATILITTFAAAQVTFSNTFYSTPGPAAGVVSGDFNRDGRPDMAVANGQSEPSTVSVFLGTGGGKFGASTDYTVTREPSKILTADLNKDGALDLIFDHGQSSASQTNVLSVLLGNGNGTFRAGTDLLLPGNVFDFDLGDFNRDGAVDMATTECDSSETCDLQLEINSGAGTFSPGWKIQMTARGISLSARDMNGDGNLDVILVRTNEVLLFTGNSAGELRGFSHYRPPAVCTSGSGCIDKLSSVAVGDFNNDARLDFAVLQAHACGEACGDNTLYIYKNLGNVDTSASFSRFFSERIGPTAAGMLIAADLNGDQNIDLINSNGARSDGGNIYVPGRGDGTFGAEQGLPGSEVSDFRVRDLNLDSRHDIMVGTYLGFGVDVGLNTSAFTNCAPPNSANVAAKICGPANNATVTSPVLVKASGNSPAGILRLEIWIDGVKQYQKWNDQVAKKFSLASGSHRLAVVAVDLYKGTAKSAVLVNVQ